MPLLINVNDLDDYQEELELKLSRFDIALLVRCCALVRRRQTITREQNAFIGEVIEKLEGAVDRVDKEFAATHPDSRYIDWSHHANG